ncbi:MAG: NAD-binding protein [Campylobacterales bacterium]
MLRKIVIYDYSDVAKELLKNLRVELDQIIIATNNRENFTQAANDGFSPVLTDLSDDENLIKIGVGSGITDFFCVTDDDDLNLFVTLSVRALSTDVNILARASDANSKRKLILAGANETIDFNEIGATRAFHLLKRPTALGLIDSVVYADKTLNGREHGIEIAEIEVERSSNIDQKYLFDLDIGNSYDIILLGLRDKQISKRFIFNVNSFNHKIDAGDVLVVMGGRAELTRFRRECIGGER